MCLEAYTLLYRLAKVDMTKEVHAYYQNHTFSNLASISSKGISYAQLAQAERDVAFANYTEGIATLNALLKQFPKNTYILNLLARAHLRNGYPTLAKRCLLTIRDCDPGCVTGMDELAIIYAGEGDIVAINKYFSLHEFLKIVFSVSL